MEKSQHTSLPWHVDPAVSPHEILCKDGYIGQTNNYKLLGKGDEAENDRLFHANSANAQFIVKAANAYYDLLEAAQLGLIYLTEVDCANGVTGEGFDRHIDEGRVRQAEAINQIQTAIKKAENK